MAQFSLTPMFTRLFNHVASQREAPQGFNTFNNSPFHQPTVVYNYLMGGYSEDGAADGARLFSKVHRDRMRGSRWKMGSTD